MFTFSLFLVVPSSYPLFYCWLMRMPRVCVSDSSQLCYFTHPAHISNVLHRGGRPVTTLSPYKPLSKVGHTEASASGPLLVFHSTFKFHQAGHVRHGSCAMTHQGYTPDYNSISMDIKGNWFNGEKKGRDACIMCLLLPPPEKTEYILGTPIIPK